MALLAPWRFVLLQILILARLNCHGPCAVKGVALQRVKVPAREIGLFHPVAVETDEEVTNRLKLSMSKGRYRRFSKQAGRNVSER